MFKKPIKQASSNPLGGKEIKKVCRVARLGLCFACLRLLARREKEWKVARIMAPCGLDELSCPWSMAVTLSTDEIRCPLQLRGEILRKFNITDAQLETFFSSKHNIKVRQHVHEHA